jgi:PAS domain S-box-containing protein
MNDHRSSQSAAAPSHPSQGDPELERLQRLVARLQQIEQDKVQLALFLQELIELLPVGIVVHINGRIILVNPAGTRMLGASDPDELIGRNAFDFVHPDELEGVHQRIRDLMGRASNEAVVAVPFLEERLLTQDGRVFDAEVAAIRMAPMDDGEVPILVLFRDITEQKRQRRQLEESEARFRLLVEMLPDGVVIHKDRRIIFANRTVAELLKMASPRDLVGRMIDEFLLDEERPLVLERIRTLLAEGEAPAHGPEPHPPSQRRGLFG